MSTTNVLGSFRPISARPRSTVGARISPEMQASLDDVQEETDDTEMPLSDTVPAETASTTDAAKSPRRHHRRRHVPLRSRTPHEILQKHRTGNNSLINNITPADIDSLDDHVRNVDAQADEMSTVSGTHASEPASGVPGQATSHKTGTHTVKKILLKRPTRHRRKKSIERSLTVNDAADEMYDVSSMITEKQSMKAENMACTRTPLKHSRSQKLKRNCRSKSVVTNHCSGSDYQLKLNNPEIKNWLRRKNRLLRKKRAEERKKKRQQKIAKEQERKIADAQKAESAKRVHAWMQEKLLKQRRDSEHSSSVTQAEKISAVIHQTFELESDAKPITVELTPKNLPPAVAVAETQENHSKHKQHRSMVACSVSDQHDADQRGKSATLAHTQQVDSTTTAIHERRPPTRITLPQGELQPVPAVANVERAHSLSFDDWLAMKRRQAAASRRQAERSSSRFDSEESDIIRQVARRRIETILTGRTRVDTGRGISDRGTLVEYPRVAIAGMNPIPPSNHPSSSNQTSTVERHHQVRNVGASECQRPAPSTGTGTTPRHPQTKRRPMQSVDLSNNLLPQNHGTATNRPSSSFPARSLTPSRTRRALSRVETTAAGDDVNSNETKISRQALVTGDSFSIKKLEACIIPRPTTKLSKAHRAVIYQQKSWDKFSDHIWEDIIESEGAVVPTDRPEPLGSDKPEVVEDTVPSEPNPDFPAQIQVSHLDVTGPAGVIIDQTSNTEAIGSEKSFHDANDGQRNIVAGESSENTELSDNGNLHVEKLGSAGSKIAEVRDEAVLEVSKCIGLFGSDIDEKPPVPATSLLFSNIPRIVISDCETADLVDDEKPNDCITHSPDVAHR